MPVDAGDGGDGGGVGGIIRFEKKVASQPV